MNLHDGGHAGGVAMNVTEKSQRLAVEASQWVDGNLVGILIAVAIAALLVAAMLAVRSLGCKLIARWGGDPHWPGIFARALAKTKLYFIVATSAQLVAEYANTPPALLQAIHVAFVIAASLQAAIWARELILGFVEHRAGIDDEHKRLGSAMGIIRLLVTVALCAIALIVILDNLGVNVTGLVAGLGIGGIAIGLAAQGIFADLFAALAILFDKPFRRGDTIRYDQSTGTVEKIGLKTTRLRSLTGEQLIMANTKLLEREIHNYAQASTRRSTLYFAVEAQTPGDKLAQVPTLASEAVAAVKGCKLVRCAANAVGAGAIGFELVYDDRALDNNRIAQNRSAVLLALIDRLRGAGIEIERASELPPPLAPF
jgi:small-conductance mechanosensitive channel